jgi:hypothetical protein
MVADLIVISPGKMIAKVHAQMHATRETHVRCGGWDRHHKNRFQISIFWPRSES